MNNDKMNIKNLIIRRTIECIMPYNYNDNLSCIENQKIELINNFFNPLDLFVVPIGLYFIIKLHISTKR